jgi:hypothetical protein
LQHFQVEKSSYIDEKPGLAESRQFCEQAPARITLPQEKKWPKMNNTDKTRVFLSVFICVYLWPNQFFTYLTLPER